MELLPLIAILFIILIILIIYVILIALIQHFNVLYIYGGNDDSGNEADDYPYLRNFTPLSEIMERFERLRHYEPEYIIKKYTIGNLQDFNNDEFTYRENNKKQSLLLVSHPNHYLDYDLLSDYFSEKCRILAKRSDNKISSMEFWQNNKQKIKEYAMKTYKSNDTYYLREALYNMFYAITSFKPTNLVAMIKRFNATSVLDFSAGWGDRMIAAIACNVDYLGVDPNTCLQDSYREIINTFKPKKKCQVIHSGFETAEIPPYHYDLVFTSPPYFDLEEYSKESSQSIEKYSTLDNWFNNFLIVSIKKAYNLLASGGHMIIIINDSKQHKYTKRMINTVNKELPMQYLGVISYANISNDNILKSPQPMWIWKKN